MSNEKTLDEVFVETMEKVVLEKIAALEAAPEVDETEKVAGIRAWMRKAKDDYQKGRSGWTPKEGKSVASRAGSAVSAIGRQSMARKVGMGAAAAVGAGAAGYGAYRAVKALKNRKKHKK